MQPDGPFPVRVFAVSLPGDAAPDALFVRENGQPVAANLTAISRKRGPFSAALVLDTSEVAKTSFWFSTRGAVVLLDGVLVLIGLGVAGFATAQRRSRPRRRFRPRSTASRRDTVRRVIVDSAVYRDGLRAAEPDDFAELHAACKTGDGVAWLGLYEPSSEEFWAVAREFDLHELAVEDAVKAHQRPKLERYGDTLFLVLRPARYVDETETVLFGEVGIFVGRQFVITVRHGDAPELGPVRQRLETRPDLLRRGPLAIAYAIVDHVVDGYEPVVAGLENDIDEIEEEVFSGSHTVSRRIYELAREVIEFQRATRPLDDILGRLRDEPGTGEEEGRYLRDVQDHAIRIEEQAAAFRALLQNILSVNLTLETKAMTEASHAQNEQVKRISAWAAILFAPTLVGTIYGMNFEHMPELGWRFGYPFAVALMVLFSVGLYVVFKRRRWI